MIRWFGDKQVTGPVFKNEFDHRHLGVKTIRNEQKIEMGVIRYQLWDKTFRGIDFAILLRGTILTADFLGPERNYLGLVWSNKNGLNGLVSILNPPISMVELQALLAMNLLRAEKFCSV